MDARTALPASVRVYERLFTEANPNSTNYLEVLNPNSLRAMDGLVEPAVVASEESAFQFERLGYFVKDAVDYAPTRPVFNRTVALRDSYKPKAA